MQALFPAEIPWLAADWPLADRFVAGTSMTANPLVTQGFNLARHVAVGAVVTSSGAMAVVEPGA